MLSQLQVSGSERNSTTLGMRYNDQLNKPITKKRKCIQLVTKIFLQ